MALQLLNYNRMRIFKTDDKQEYFTDEGCHITEILNDPVKENLSIAQARVEPGQRTRLHALTGTSEVYYILDGEAVVTINEEIQRLEKGDCVIISPEHAQCIENTGTTDLIFLCVCQPRFQFSNYKDVEP